jgi:SAM-dependent methyltransferase
MSRRLERDYFEALYAERDDPWDFETSPYEAAKYDATLDALGTRRFGRALEAGCSIGVLTARLAGRCDALLAVDVSERAVEKARARLAGLPQVRVERRTLPDDLPAGPFDLIVCSEVLYYWSRALLTATVPALAGALAPGGSLLAVHWRPPTRTYPLLGDEVHDLLAERLARLDHAVSRVEPEYRLDRWDAPR